MARLRKHDINGAIADYSKAIELDPEFADAYEDRAEAEKLKGDVKGAEADLKQAKDLNPE